MTHWPLAIVVLRKRGTFCINVTRGHFAFSTCVSTPHGYPLPFCHGHPGPACPACPPPIDTGRASSSRDDDSSSPTSPASSGDDSLGFDTEPFVSGSKARRRQTRHERAQDSAATPKPPAADAPSLPHRRLAHALPLCRSLHSLPDQPEWEGVRLQSEPSPRLGQIPLLLSQGAQGAQ